MKNYRKPAVRLCVIGLGRRGYGMLDKCFSEMADVRIVALCDLDRNKIARAAGMLAAKGKPEPAAYTDYREMFAAVDADAAVIMTGWNAHVDPALAAMRAGLYTAIEVGCAYDLSECFALVDTFEQTHAPLMMLENCCYGRREMMALRMVREGLFGEIVHCAGGYHHYLNDAELFYKRKDGSVDTDHYRIYDYAVRNAEQYPTHELGPISKILKINRGNRMLSLSSFASKARGLETYMKDHVPADHPLAGKTFRQGDIVQTVITCAGGETILLTLDTTLPRPYYSRGFTVRGTKGMCTEASGGVCTWFLEGMKEGVFKNEAEMFGQYDHPLHREYSALGERGGHGGMDWLVSRAFIESVKEQTAPPIDAYDTAAWMAIGPLSEQSIALGGAPVPVPDFTRGKWFRREPAPVSKYGLDDVAEDPETPIFPE